MSDPTEFRSIYIWSVADEKLTRVTGESFNEYGPAWGAAGNYLYFLSDRGVGVRALRIWSVALP